MPCSPVHACSGPVWEPRASQWKLPDGHPVLPLSPPKRMHAPSATSLPTVLPAYLQSYPFTLLPHTLFYLLTPLYSIPSPFYCWQGSLSLWRKGTDNSVAEPAPKAASPTNPLSPNWADDEVEEMTFDAPPGNLVGGVPYRGPLALPVPHQRSHLCSRVDVSDPPLFTRHAMLFPLTALRPFLHLPLRHETKCLGQCSGS